MSLRHDYEELLDKLDKVTDAVHDAQRSAVECGDDEVDGMLMDALVLLVEAFNVAYDKAARLK